jgi:hypothetical protein
VLFEATRKISLARNAIATLHAIYETGGDTPERMEKKVEAVTGWNDAADELDAATALVALVCGNELYKLLLNFSHLSRNIVHRMRDQGADVLFDSARDFVAKSDTIMLAMRKELGLEIPSRPPQSVQPAKQ